MKDQAWSNHGCIQAKKPGYIEGGSTPAPRRRCRGVASGRSSPATLKGARRGNLRPRRGVTSRQSGLATLKAHPRRLRHPGAVVASRRSSLATLKDGSGHANADLLGVASRQDGLATLKDDVVMAHCLHGVLHPGKIAWLY